VKHLATAQFWKLFERLSPEIQDLARAGFRRLKSNPRHPALRLKKVGRFWSVRVGLAHRALAVEFDQGLLWFWIGTHADMTA